MLPKNAGIKTHEIHCIFYKSKRATYKLCEGSLSRPSIAARENDCVAVM